MGLLDQIRGKFKGPVDEGPIVEIDKAIENVQKESVDVMDTSESTFDIESEIPSVPKEPVKPTTYQEREAERQKYEYPSVPSSEVTAEIPSEDVPLKPFEEILPEYEPEVKKKKEPIVDIDTVVSKGKPSRRDGEETLERLDTTPEITGKYKFETEEESEEEKKESAKEEKKEESKEEKKESTKEEPTKSTKDEFPKEPVKKEGRKTSWDTFKENIGWYSPEDKEYARKGGYYGKPREDLEIDKQKIEDSIERNTTRIEELTKEIKIKEVEHEKLFNKKNKTEEEKERLDDLKRQIAALKAERQILLQGNADKEKAKDRLNVQIEKYEEAVKRGKEQASKEPSRIGKKLSNLGKGAAEIQSGLYGGTGGTKLIKSTWFGKTGFLDKPQVASSIPIEPVKGGSTKLSGYTRLTGSTVRGGVSDALVNIRANKVISPLGVPSRSPVTREFTQNVPLRQIPLSSINKASVNPAILPNIYDIRTPQVSQPVEYMQVIQADGSIVNVPVTTQQRKPKITSISVNRVQLHPPSSKNGVAIFSIPHSPHLNKATKRDKMISRGISNAGDVDCIYKLNILEPLAPRTLKSVTLGTRPQIELGLISAKQTGLKLTMPHDKSEERIINVAKVQERKQKKMSSLVNLNVSKQISKNINNIVSKQKKK